MTSPSKARMRAYWYAIGRWDETVARGDEPWVRPEMFATYAEGLQEAYDEGRTWHLASIPDQFRDYVRGPHTLDGQFIHE